MAPDPMEGNSSIGNFQNLTDGYRIVAALRQIQGFRAHDPEKWIPVFGPDHAPIGSDHA
jgi:hypothetical protein